MRLIDADQAVAEAERLLELYNLAMAGAETNREINHVFKRQELFKAVRAVVNACPTVDPVKHGHWIKRNTVGTATCSICGGIIYNSYDSEAHSITSNSFPVNASIPSGNINTFDFCHNITSFS